MESRRRRSPKKRWTRVRATRIGRTTEGLNPTTAYGAGTDRDKFVALPAREVRGRWVEIRLRNGDRAVVPVGDLGPGEAPGGEVNDPFWKTGTKPKFKAGIDLSQELWEELGIKGGETNLDWRFTPPPKHRSPS